MMAVLPYLALIVFVISVPAVLVPGLVIAERRVSAFIQGRVGPNRVGPWGLLQPLADVFKFIFKEGFRPKGADTVLYWLAPMLVMMPPFIALCVIPFGDQWKFSADLPAMKLVLADLGIGVLFLMAFLSVAVYGLAFGGWSSNNKYSLLGGLRASAQIISYEIALTLSILTMVVWNQTLTLTGVIDQQIEHGWNILYPPGLIGFFLFFIAAMAENNRLPFDLPECEAELVGGYHTEYGGTRFALFFMGEYVAMVVMCMLMAVFFFGGWHFPGLTGPSDDNRTLWSAALTFGIFMAKTVVFLFIYIWIRWTLPRFRYDQLMNIGWKLLIPLALANFAFAAVWRQLEAMP